MAESANSRGRETPSREEGREAVATRRCADRENASAVRNLQVTPLWGELRLQEGEGVVPPTVAMAVQTFDAGQEVLWRGSRPERHGIECLPLSHAATQPQSSRGRWRSGEQNMGSDGGSGQPAAYDR